jgi:nitrogen fixation NifU-like protein
MSDSIYNAAIVAAGRDRSHAGRLEAPDASVTRDNPLCGDRVTLDLALRGGRVERIAHKTRGCLLSEAAAALLARRAPADAEDLAALLDAVRRFLAGDAPAPSPDLAMFEPIRQVKSRHECVLLPFEALAEALAAQRRG